MHCVLGLQITLDLSHLCVGVELPQIVVALPVCVCARCAGYLQRYYWGCGDILSVTTEGVPVLQD